MYLPFRVRNRARKRFRFNVGQRENVEREPLRRLLPDSGERRELVNQVLK
jgi:hypothetical protein